MLSPVKSSIEGINESLARDHCKEDEDRTAPSHQISYADFIACLPTIQLKGRSMKDLGFARCK